MKLELNQFEEKEIEKHILEGLGKVMNNIGNKFALDLSAYYLKGMEAINDIISAKNDKLYQLLLNKVKFLSNIKVIFHDIEVFEKIDAEDYVIKYFKNDDYKYVVKWNDQSINWLVLPLDIQQIRYVQQHRKGRPDLLVYGNDDIYFLVEVKTNGDGLRAEQMRWIQNHPNICTIVFYLNQTFSVQNKKDTENK